MIKRRKPIRKVSLRQAKLNREYYRRLKIWKAKPESKHCAVCLSRMVDGTMQVAHVRHTDDCHHSKGRGRYLLDESTWIPVCRTHHDWIGQNPAQAMKEGWIKSRLAKV